MKTKNIYKRLLILSLSISTISCSTFLDEELDTTIIKSELFSSKEGLEAAINGAYSSMGNGDYYGTSWHLLVMPHSGLFHSNQTASTDATSLNCTPTNISLPQLWEQMYRTVNITNEIITNIKDTDFSNRDTILAQAYFLRAVTYFDLVRLFGDIPLRLEPTTVYNIHKPKATKQAIYDQVIADFEKAKLLLPSDYTTYERGRPLKWAAYGYLAKVYMTLAGEDGGNPSYWQNAKDELNFVMGKYTLVGNYASLFTETQGISPVVENTSESIFELQYTYDGLYRNNDLIRIYTPSRYSYLPVTIPTFGRVKPNKEVYARHKSQYPGDPRINATYIYNTYPRYQSDDVTISNQNIYPNQLSGNNSFTYIKKWLDHGYSGTTTYRNMILFRYSDVLLMMAEIENELSGPTSAYPYVNAVLARARTSVSPAAVQPADWSGMTQDEFRIRIMRERQYELLSEGQEWFDTRRRGYQFFINNVVIPHNNFTHNTTSGVDYVYPISVKNMLLPIPSRELETNQALTPADQNPGY